MLRRLIVLRCQDEKAYCTSPSSQSALPFPPHLVPPPFQQSRLSSPVPIVVVLICGFGFALPPPLVLLSCPFPSSLRSSAHPLTPRVQCLRPPSRAHPVLCCLITFCLPFRPSPLPHPAVSLTPASMNWSPPAFLHPSLCYSLGHAHVRMHLDACHKSHAFTRVSNEATRTSSATLSE